LRWLNAGRPPSVRIDKLRRANEAGGLSRMAQIHSGSGRTVMRALIPARDDQPAGVPIFAVSPAAVRIAAPKSGQNPNRAEKKAAD
jgi:hypothetical protein